MRRLVIAGIFTFVSLLASHSSNAEVGGGVFLQVEDSSSHSCIDITKYDVSMMVVALQAARTESWWKQSKTMGAKFDVVILNKEGKEFTFPRGALLSAKDIRGDIALLPIKYPIMSKYSLTGDQPYVNVSLNFYLISSETLSQPINGVLEFIEFSKSLPLPPNPYVQGVQHFADFAQKIFSANVRTAEEREPVAIFSFDLPSSVEDVRQCPGQGLREGINAVMFSHPGSTQDGFITLGDYTRYCYHFDAVAARILFRPKKPEGCDLQAPATPLRNPLVAFVVSRWSKNPAGTSSVAAVSSINPAMASPHGSSSISTSADLAVSKLNRGDAAAADVRSDNVRKILNVLNGGASTSDLRTTVESLGQTTNPARVREAETAINLHLCSLAGISPVECQ